MSIQFRPRPHIILNSDHPCYILNAISTTKGAVMLCKTHIFVHTYLFVINYNNKIRFLGGMQQSMVRKPLISALGITILKGNTKTVEIGCILQFCQ